jgi:hypothetical protein
MDGRKKYRTSIQAVFIYLIGMAAVTLVEFMSINQTMGGNEAKLLFDFKNLKAKLPGLLTSYAAIACYTVATLTACIAKFKETNEEYLATDKNISNFARDNYKPTLFGRYCSSINKKRKIAAWKRRCYKQWEKLEKLEKNPKNVNAWMKYSVALDDYEKALKKFKEDKENGAENLEIPMMPETDNRYCTKRKKLETYLSQDYIDNNIERLKIKFDAITAGLVLGGVTSQKENILTEDAYVTKHKSLKVIADRAPQSLSTMTIVMFCSSVVIDSFALELNWTAWLLFVFKLITKIYS